MDQINFIIPKEAKTFRTDLPFYGEDLSGNQYTADGMSLLRNGRRFIPVMGEFHFSRFEPQFWREEILKMKAGGIDIVATYMFWIYHEEQQDEWDFSGCRDVRKFVEICGECGVKVWLRIGPWSHGECRNGGFPDWLQYDSSFEKRTNDPKYLDLVRSWFERVFEQVQGLFIKDGGPILGVQLENEYGHCGGPQDREEQAAHMKKLYEMAREAGFIVPYYTATAWGGACTIDETLQVLSGYVDAPWESNADPLPPKDNFRFIPYLDDGDVGSDFEKGDGTNGTIRADFPYLTAELGGGLQVTSHRRPVASSKDNEAAILCALGSGANLLGYYMYHGGINPDGKYSTLNEAQDIGGHTNTPKKSYDFDACLNEAGKPQESFGGLKKYAIFLHSFGEDLAGAETILPLVTSKNAADCETVRASLRVNRKSGNAYLFVNGHQRLYELCDHPDTEITVALPDGSVLWYEHLSFEAGKCYLYHFNIYNETSRLFQANPLCVLGDRSFYWIDGTSESTTAAAVDFARRKNRLSFDPRIEILTESSANRAFLYPDGLYITQYDDSILIEDNGVKKLITSHRKETLTVFLPDGGVDQKTVFETGTEAEPTAEVLKVSEFRDQEEQIAYCDYCIKMDYTGIEDAHRIFLQVNYLGDRAEVYNPDGKLLDDWFTTGKPWRILLDRFGRPEELRIRIYDSGHPMICKFTDQVYYDLHAKSGCKIQSVKIEKEFLYQVQ
ncbi:MAG: beta-galactosidase [Lachnospiraceae bacterium]|nr:beta-galactosidase [Lachnospiraceae bacterium]